MQREIYQFNLDFLGNYVQGEKTSTNADGFFVIEPTYIHITVPNIIEIKPTDNKLYLSKNSVVCYFKIK